MATEKCPDHDREGDEMPAQPGENAAGDHQGDRKMNRENPLRGEFANPRPPIAERKIQEKYYGRYNPECHAP